MFESLDEQYQERALDEVAKNFQNNIFANWFKHESKEQPIKTLDFLASFMSCLGGKINLISAEFKNILM